MSGIAGIHHTDGRPVDETDMQRMLIGIAHRGPDGAGAWTAGPIGLGHQMLWTTPESLKEEQPLSSEDGCLWLTADARVDNRVELRATLLANGARLRTDTDAEMILRSYEIWGESCPSRIIGDFAFVIWDARNRRLFCARDPLGIKPFYYHFDGKSFRWASTPQAIFMNGSISQQPNLTVICQSLLNRCDNREETLHKDILRLLPAHSLVLEHGRLRTQRYWEIDPAHTVRHRTDAEYAEHFLELFRNAVAAQLRSCGGVGGLLSGGLDSSSIVCIARQIDRERVPSNLFEAFSIVFDQLACDESFYIQEVVQKCGLRANRFRQREHDSWLDFERTDKYFDCIYAPTLFMLGPALEQAQQNNIRTMLTGIGGDELFASSVVHLTDFARQRRFSDLFKQIQYDADLSSCSRWLLFKDYCVKPFIPRVARAAMKSIVKPLRGSATPAWVTSDCFRNAGAIPTSNHSRGRFPTAAQQRIHDSLEHGWNTNVALGRLDAFASHFAIECRHPFFNRPLIEFMMAVPEEQRWFGPYRKTILRRAMDSVLPESVRCRKSKADFTPLVDRAFKDRQPDKVDRLLQTSVLGDMGVIQVQEFRRLFEQYKQGTVLNDMRRACQNIVGLELWCRSAMRIVHNYP